MPQTIKGLSEKDTAANRDVTQRFEKAFLARDFDALAHLYTEDAVLMPPHAPAVKGRNAVRSWMSNFPKVTRFKLTEEHVDGRDDLAYVHGSVTMTIEAEGGAEPVESKGKYLEIRRRQSEGSWLIDRDIFNMDEPA